MMVILTLFRHAPMYIYVAMLIELQRYIQFLFVNFK
jgi:hypothetical protein